MTMHDLATLVQEELPVKIALSNNSYLGMVRQWQELFYDKRYEATHLWANPDFVKLADAYGIRAWRATNLTEAVRAVEEARAHDGPAFIDFQIIGEGDEGNVYPMVAANKALSTAELSRRAQLEATTRHHAPNSGSFNILIKWASSVASREATR